MTKHRLYKNRSYQCWHQMMYRCYKPNHAAFKSYGGRGILVCKRWHSLFNFIEDMGERPEGMTIERIDNNRGYSPKNCKWATLGEQGINKRNSRRLSDGRTIAEWSHKLGISRSTLRGRLERGWTVNQLSKPPDKRHHAKTR